MERARPTRVTEAAGLRARPTVASFGAAGPRAVGSVVLGEDAAHHARVRRLVDGEPVTVRDGAGTVAAGRIARLGKRTLDVAVDVLQRVAPPAPVHVLVPAADRDRMLWLAEKAVEIGITSWRAVRWQRSRSVSPRGEGDAFVAKLRARMEQALAQSEGAWLPELHDAADVDDVLPAVPAAARWLLDGDGATAAWTDRDEAFHDVPLGICVAVGPEGGLEPAEIARCESAGFRRVRLPGHVLRFETAGVIGIAFARAFVDRARASSDPHPSAVHA